MKLEVSGAYITALQLHGKMTSLVKKRNVKKATISSSIYENIDLPELEDFIPSHFTVLQMDVYIGLSKRAASLVNKIVSELHENNALWKFDQRRNKRDQKAISELRLKQILFKTEDCIIHFVNPQYIRRGTPAGVLFNMIHLLENCSRVTPEYIRNLRARKTGFVNPIDKENLGSSAA